MSKSIFLSEDFLLWEIPVLITIIGIIIGFWKSKKFIVANKALNKGEYEKAIILYTEIINKNPRHGTAHYNMGIALEKLKKHDEALTAYNKTIELDNRNINAHLQKGIILRNLGKYEDALKEINTILEINKNYSTAYLNMGIILELLKKHDESLQAYNNAIKIDPKEILVHYLKGILLKQLNRYQEIEGQDKVIEIDKNYAKAYLNKGVILEEINEEDALKAYNEAIKIDTKLIEAYIKKVDILKRLERYEELIETYNKIIQISKETNNKELSKLIYLGKGLLLGEKLNKPQESIEMLNEAIRIDNDFKEAYLAKWKIAKDCNNNEEEVLACNNIIRIDKYAITFYSNKRIALENLGKHNEALATINTALEIYDKLPEQKKTSMESLGLDKGILYYLIACSYNFMNQLDNTLINLKKAIELNKNCIKDAKNDNVFDNIRNNHDFKKIIGDNI